MILFYCAPSVPVNGYPDYENEMFFFHEEYQGCQLFATILKAKQKFVRFPIQGKFCLFVKFLQQFFLK